MIKTRLIAAAALSGCLLAVPADAVEIEMYFFATIEDIVDEFDGEARVGDQIEGVIYFDTATMEDAVFPGNYTNAITSFDIAIIPSSGPNEGAFIPLLSDFGVGDLFVGTNSIEAYYFVDIFSGNFGFQLNEGPIFDQNLMTAGDELVQTTNDSPFGDALDAFADPFENSSFTIQTDYTFGNTFATFDFVQFTIVPEPGSLALLSLGGLMIARRRRA